VADWLETRFFTHVLGKWWSADEYGEWMTPANTFLPSVLTCQIWSNDAKMKI